MTPSQPSPTNLSDELDRILQNYKEYVTGIYQGVANYDEETAKAAITAAYAEAMNEIIGEDEPEEVTYFNSIRPVNINKWRNQLRAELRAAIQEMEGEL